MHYFLVVNIDIGTPYLVFKHLKDLNFLHHEGAKFPISLWLILFCLITFSAIVDQLFTSFETSCKIGWL